MSNQDRYRAGCSGNSLRIISHRPTQTDTDKKTINFLLATLPGEKLVMAYGQNESVNQ